AVARIARAGLDLDQALADFRHFDLEQLHHEFRRGARDEQLRPAHFRTHLEQIAAHAVAYANGFARNGLVARDEAFRVAAEIDVEIAALDALDHAGHQLADAILEGIHHLRALGLADALHDHLLGRLRGDAAEFRILDLLLDELADLRAGALVLGVHLAQLEIRRFHLAVVGDHFPAAESFVVAALAVDADADIRLLAGIALLGGGRQRGLDRLEDHLARHAFFIGDGV